MKIDKIEIQTENKENKNSLDNELNKIKAYVEECKAATVTVEYVCRDDYMRSMDYMYNVIDRVRSLVYETENRFYNNLERIFATYTFVPKLTPSQLEKLLEVVGASQDYQVGKKYATASENKGNTLEIEIKKKEV